MAESQTTPSLEAGSKVKEVKIDKVDEWKEMRDRLTPPGFKFLIATEAPNILHKIPGTRISSEGVVFLDSQTTPLYLQEVRPNDWVQDMKEFNDYLVGKMDKDEISKNLLNKYVDSKAKEIYFIIGDFVRKPACFKWIVPESHVGKVSYSLLIYLHSLTYHFMYKIEDTGTTIKKPHFAPLNRYESNGLFKIHSHYLEQLIYNDKWCIAYATKPRKEPYIYCTFGMDS